MNVITVRQMAVIKRTAQNVRPLVAKREKVLEKIQELNAEYEQLSQSINNWESGVVTMTGYPTDYLVKRVVIPTMSENGSSYNVTKYEPNFEHLTPMDNGSFTIKDDSYTEEPVVVNTNQSNNNETQENNQFNEPVLY